MRTTRLLISVIMFALSLNGWCEVFSVDRIRYSTLRGDSSVSVEYYLYEGDIVIPSTVTYNEKTYIVTSIGKNAFLGRYLVTSVTIPEGVTRIGDSAFSGCTGLTSMTIPSSVTSIENHVFSGCM